MRQMALIEPQGGEPFSQATPGSTRDDMMVLYHVTVYIKPQAALVDSLARSDSNSVFLRFQALVSIYKYATLRASTGVAGSAYLSSTSQVAYELIYKVSNSFPLVLRLPEATRLSSALHLDRTTDPCQRQHPRKQMMSSYTHISLGRAVLGRHVPVGNPSGACQRCL